MDQRAFKFKGPKIRRPLICHICGQTQRSTTFMKNHLERHSKSFAHLADTQAMTLKESNLQKLKKMFK